MKISILKPDHIGDLILSAPAINKLLSMDHQVSLLINKNTEFLARFLFPNISLDYVTLSHLSRNGEMNSTEIIYRYANNCDLFISLRNDPELGELVLSHLNESKSLIIENSLDIHETILQSRCIQPLTGDYDPLTYFKTFKNQVKPWPDKFHKIGFVISAGFFNNSLSVSRWYEFAQYFIENHLSEITIICGPNEKKDALILKHLIGTATILEGTKNVGDLLEKVSELDLLIATDSGSAHLCSLSGTPILSLFGASPYKRYHPIGKNNRIIKLNFNCSPCPQFEVNSVNSCITKECLSSITVKNIAEALI